MNKKKLWNINRKLDAISDALLDIKAGIAVNERAMKNLEARLDGYFEEYLDIKDLIRDRDDWKNLSESFKQQRDGWINKATAYEKDIGALYELAKNAFPGR